jgi:2-polyprenyl-3-methyl-5-hydroxy-6-metoxy-1,4-benzoquinol methylase
MYTGIDSSPGLIEIASSQAAQPAEPGASKPARGPRARFILADLAAPSWTDILFTELAAAHLKPSFDVILCLAVLHHLPGQSLRLQTLQKARHLQEGIPDAWLCLSAWQFLNSPRWQRRIQPWHSAGIEASQVEEGDYLLDWRHGGTGLRYVHLFQPDELAELAIQSGYRVQETFLADGENERLGLYQVWRAV